MGRLISEKYAAWQAECEERFQQLKKNEEELNRIFIDIYGLQDELTPDVADKDVTVHRVFDSKDDVPESMKGSNYVRTMRDEIVSLISYAVGCMFGRYSLDVDGLAYAGGEWDASKYKTIIPDSDNIIPICDDEYFDDDITGRFVEFVRKVYGDDKVGTIIKVSQELLADSAFDLERYFTSEFTRRIGTKEEEAFLVGNGSHKPTGLLNETGGAQIGVTAASATAITADEVIDLFYSLAAPYRKNAIWILNDATVKAIRKLKDSSGQYLWQPALKDGEFDTILGKRYFTSAYMPTIAAGAKTILFGDLSYYWIGDRQGITFQRLNERFADYGQVGFLASKRLDGKLVLPEAVKVLQQKAGSST